MKKKSVNEPKVNLETMIKHGTINILALGYKGVEAWRNKRATKNEKKD